MAEFVSLGPCSFSLRRKELATVTILSQILSVIFASLNSLIRKTDRLAPRSERETDGEIMAEGPRSRAQRGQMLFLHFYQFCDWLSGQL